MVEQPIDKLDPEARRRITARIDGLERQALESDALANDFAHCGQGAKSKEAASLAGNFRAQAQGLRERWGI
jgi:hypothetical protein